MVPQMNNHGIQGNSHIIQDPSMAQTLLMPQALPLV
jgi:hypothetical protein